ncbi:MAG: endonuclease III [Planctomycetota bacterium]|nr:endonuclease III [Planctomycetota bacterium]MCX8039114.1 endonuclease III [Planctomycetota bacterium]MDW8373708.1 endonuclease III [Planctomycetota bacterium]
MRRGDLLSDAEVRAVFAALAARLAPRCELVHGSAFELLVAVVLSAQASDAQVNRVTAELFARARSPQDLVRLGEQGVAACIRSLGLWRAKARHLVALSQRLLAEHGGEVPADREALMALPGVGRKTANVVLNVWFQQETFAVDTHVQRVSNRLGLCRTRRPIDTERALEQRVPPPYRRHAHAWLVLLGRYTCTARRPRCEACPVAAWCRRHGLPTAPPPARARTPAGSDRARP